MVPAKSAPDRYLEEAIGVRCVHKQTPGCRRVISAYCYRKSSQNNEPGPLLKMCKNIWCMVTK